MYIIFLYTNNDHEVVKIAVQRVRRKFLYDVFVYIFVELIKFSMDRHLTSVS